MCVCVCVYIYIFVCVCVCIYIYIERERERMDLLSTLTRDTAIGTVSLHQDSNFCMDKVSNSCIIGDHIHRRGKHVGLFLGLWMEMAS